MKKVYPDKVVVVERLEGFYQPGWELFLDTNDYKYKSIAGSVFGIEEDDMLEYIRQGKAKAKDEN